MGREDPRSPWNCAHFLPHLILFSPPTHTPPREFSSPCWISRRTSSGCKTESDPSARRTRGVVCCLAPSQPPAYSALPTVSPALCFPPRRGNGQAAGSRRKGGGIITAPLSCQETAAGGGWIPLLRPGAPARQSPLGESRAHWLQRPLVRPRGGNGSPLLPALQVFHHILLAFFYHTYMLENGPSHKGSPITHGSVPAGP